MYDPAYREPQVAYGFYNPNNQGNSYNMYPMPPPVYDPASAPPPGYNPPPGGTKVDPGQTRVTEQGSTSAQPLQAQNTAQSNNPFR